MRHTLKLECIGDNVVAMFRQCDRFEKLVGISDGKGDYKDLIPWVARITGFDDKYYFAREFQQGQKDYSEANRIGSRGVYLYFYLKQGIYEVCELTNKRAIRYFLRVIDSDKTIQLTKDEVIECLKKDS